MAGARGIEVFGRGATVVEPRQARPRTPVLGGVSVLLAVIAAAALAWAIVERANRSGLAPVLTWIALCASVAAVLLGVFAVLTSRGRRLAVLGVVLGALANPWLLSRLLEGAAALQG